MRPVNYTVRLPLAFEGSRQARISILKSGETVAARGLTLNAIPAELSTLAS